MNNFLRKFLFLLLLSSTSHGFEVYNPSTREYIPAKDCSPITDDQTPTKITYTRCNKNNQTTVSKGLCYNNLNACEQKSDARYFRPAAFPEKATATDNGSSTTPTSMKPASAPKK